MKKNWSILMLVMIVILFCGCGAKSAAPAEACDLDAAAVQENNMYSMERVSGTGGMKESQETEEASGREIPAEAAAEPEPLAYATFTQHSDAINADDGSKLFISRCSVPQFVTEEDSVNIWLESMVQTAAYETAVELRQIEQLARDDFKSRAGEDRFGFYAYSYYSDADIQRLDSRLISALQVVSIYSGGAHPNYAQLAYNLDLSARRVLSLGDVILPGGAVLLQNQVISQLLDRFGGLESSGLYADYPEIVTSYFQNDNLTPNWYFSENGLVIYFNCYDIAPYAAGIIKVELPYATLDGILKPGFYPTDTLGAFGELTLLDSAGGRRLLLEPAEGECLYLGTDQVVYDVRIQTITGWLTDGVPMAGQITFAANRLTAGEAVAIPAGEDLGYLVTYRGGQEEARKLVIDAGGIRDITG